MNVAAYMSTIDSVAALSSSYLVNDFYKPYLNKDADDRYYVAVSRGTVVIAALLASAAMGHSRTIRANKGILMDITTEKKIRRALEGFVSQRRIFQDIVAHREKRKSIYGYLVLYQHVPIRPRTDFSPYSDRLARCRA